MRTYLITVSHLKQQHQPTVKVPAVDGAESGAYFFARFHLVGLVDGEDTADHVQLGTGLDETVEVAQVVVLAVDAEICAQTQFKR